MILFLIYEYEGEQIWSHDGHGEENEVIREFGYKKT